MRDREREFENNKNRETNGELEDEIYQGCPCYIPKTVLTISKTTPFQLSGRIFKIWEPYSEEKSHRYRVPRLALKFGAKKYAGEYPANPIPRTKVLVIEFSYSHQIFGNKILRM